jgi:NADH dehydrogenase FAD-containing subunit
MGGAAGGDLLLLGAGHAHLEVIRQAPRLQAAGARITVVSPPTFWYSGLATSVLAGRHTPQSNIIDVAELCRRKGVAFLEGEVVSGDVATRRVHLADGRSLSYDLLSVNLGSVVPDPIPGLAENGVPARPIPGLLALGAELAGMRGADAGDASPPPSPHHPRRIVVLGGGPTGCEVALALRTRGGEAPEITLVTPEAPPAGLGARARRIMARVLEDRGIRWVPEPAVSVSEGEVRLGQGGTLPFHHLVNCTGLIPNPTAARLGLPTGPDGHIRLSPTLEAPGHPGHFGAGDAVRVAGAGHPPAGVYSVRQAPVLVDNLLAHFTGSAPRSFSLQRPVLLILALGDGTGLATFGPLAARGRWALRWKDRLDQEWLGRYRP